MKRRSNKSSLAILAEQYGYESGLDLAVHYAMESVVPAICTSLDCEEYSTETEPDCDGGFCNYCGESNTMVSCMVLAGVI
jgi:hypothetical protein